MGGDIVLKALNATKGTVLCPRVELAATFWRRLVGFMLRRVPDGTGLLFPQCNSIHTFLLLDPLDVLFLSESGVVVEAVEGLKPWRLVPPVRGATHTLEMAAGAIRRSGTERGDKVMFVGPVDLAEGEG